jgi:hypothetical protein
LTVGLPSLPEVRCRQTRKTQGYRSVSMNTSQPISPNACLILFFASNRGGVFSSTSPYTSYTFSWARRLKNRGTSSSFAEAVELERGVIGRNDRWSNPGRRDRSHCRFKVIDRSEESGGCFFVYFRALIYFRGPTTDSYTFSWARRLKNRGVFCRYSPILGTYLFSGSYNMIGAYPGGRFL